VEYDADPNQDHSRALYASTTCLPKHWGRPSRPRQTWLRTIENDLRPLNLGLATAQRRVQNRTASSLADTRGYVADNLRMMMIMHVGGRCADLPRTPRARKSISFDLEVFNFKLLFFAHCWIWMISSCREQVFDVSTAR